MDKKPLAHPLKREKSLDRPFLLCCSGLDDTAAGVGADVAAGATTVTAGADASSWRQLAEASRERYMTVPADDAVGVRSVIVPRPLSSGGGAEADVASQLETTAARPDPLGGGGPSGGAPDEMADEADETDGPLKPLVVSPPAEVEMDEWRDGDELTPVLVWR